MSLPRIEMQEDVGESRRVSLESKPEQPESITMHGLELADVK